MCPYEVTKRSHVATDSTSVLLNPSDGLQGHSSCTTSALKRATTKWSKWNGRQLHVGGRGTAACHRSATAAKPFRQNERQRRPRPSVAKACAIFSYSSAARVQLLRQAAGRSALLCCGWLEGFQESRGVEESSRFRSSSNRHVCELQSAGVQVRPRMLWVDSSAPVLGLFGIVNHPPNDGLSINKALCSSVFFA